MDVFTIDPLTGKGPFRKKALGRTPNFLFITYDMVPVEFWSPSNVKGRVRPSSPALDELRKYASFTNAWSTSPLCGPSRASFLTGRHTYITTNSERAHDGHEHELRESDIIFPEYLKAAGWRTRHVGKCHVGASTFVRAFGENDKPWDRWSPPWYDDEDYGRHLKSFGIGEFKFARSIVFRSPGGGKGNSTGGWAEGTRGEPFPEGATYSAFTADRAIAAIEDLARRDKPFYLQVDFFEPHQPFMIPSGLEAREKELRTEVAPPKSWEEFKARRFVSQSATPRIYDLYRKYWGIEDESALKDYLVAHILQFEVLERQTARIFAKLKELGVWSGTQIVFCADHGEMNGEDALVDKGAYLHPRVTHVPVYMKPAFESGEFPSLACDSPVSLVDIAPTFLEAAGIEPLALLDGVSLGKALKSGERPKNKPVMFEVWSHVMPNPCVGGLFKIGDAEYSYIFNAVDPVDEFYVRSPDGSWDPVNRVDEKKFSDTIALCRAQFLERLSADSRWVSWESFFRLRHAESIRDQLEDQQKFVE